MLMKLFKIAAALLLSLPLYAATITDIKFVGMVHISESIAKSMLQIDIGEAMDEEKINESVKLFFKQFATFESSEKNSLSKDSFSSAGMTASAITPDECKTSPK